MELSDLWLFSVWLNMDVWRSRLSNIEASHLVLLEGGRCACYTCYTCLDTCSLRVTQPANADLLTCYWQRMCFWPERSHSDEPVCCMCATQVCTACHVTLVTLNGELRTGSCRHVAIRRMPNERIAELRRKKETRNWISEWKCLETKGDGACSCTDKVDVSNWGGCSYKVKSKWFCETTVM